MAQTGKHNLGALALAASAWIAGANGAFATEIGAEVINVATVSYSIGSETETVATNQAVFTIRPAQTPAIIEFFRHSPAAPSPINRAINGSDYSPSGDLDGPFDPIGDPVTTGGNLVDLSGEIPLIPALTYLAGELMFVRVTDTGQNFDSNAIETLEITVEADNGDLIVMRLYESDPDSGEFWAYLPSTRLATPQNDPVITASQNTQLTATYIDTFDATDVTVDTAIVDPLNRVFSSVTGELISGATITLIDLNTGQEADVFGVDGFGTFPSEVVSGEEISDSSGITYEVNEGEFRFPLLEEGRYAVRVDPPEGYRFASVMPPEALATLGVSEKGSDSFVILDASYGDEYIQNPEGPLRFDIPLDPDTDIVLNKSADRTFGDVGDFVNYTVTIENRGDVAAPVILYDTLPIGFRYVQGTSRTTQIIDDPQISDDATMLTFPMGLIQPGETINLDYALEIGPGAPMGDAVNEAVVLGSNGDQLSNIARAGIRLREDLIRSRSTIVGRISEKSCNGDEDWARNIERGIGVEGVRLYMETGAYVVSDPDGLFHFEGVSEGTHVVQVDEETLPQGFELMKCEENTRYAGAMNSKFVDVQGGGIWRANFYLKQTGARAEKIETEVFNNAKEHLEYDSVWLDSQNSDVEWVYPQTDRTPSKPSTNIGIKHGAGQTVKITVNGRSASDLNFAGKEGGADGKAMLSRWRGVDLLEGRNEMVATVTDRNSGTVIHTLREDIYYVKNIARATGMPDQSTLIADGRTPPQIAIRMEDEAGRPVHAGRITTIDVEPPYSLFDEQTLGSLIDQTQELLAPLSARQDFSVGPGGILKVKLQPTLRTGKVTVIATLDNGRKVPIYMYMEPEKRDWILVGLAEGSVGYEKISGNAVALGELEGDDVIKDGRLAFFAKGLIKGNWLMTMSVDTDTRRGSRDGDFLDEIDPNAYYTLYGDRSYQQFEGVSRYPVFVKLEKRQAYAMFGDYDTNITEGRLTSYNRRLSGLKAEYLGDKIQVLGFAAETNQGFAKDEIPADGTSGTYQLSNQRILAQSEEIVVETRDRFRPDIVLERKVMVRYLDYTLDYYTGQLIFRLPVDVSDADFNPNVIVVDYETSEDAERNLTYGGRVQTQVLNEKVQIGSSFVHEDGSALSGGVEQNMIGVDVIAQVTDNTQLRAEYAITENKGTVGNDGTSSAMLAEIIHTSDKLSGEAYFREEEAGFGLGQTNSNTNQIRRYGAKANYKISEFEDEETGRRGSRNIEGQVFREENLTTGNARNTGEILASHQGERLSIAGGLRASRDELVGSDDRQSILAIGRASLRIPKHDATLQISHEQPLGGKDEVSVYPQRTTIGVDKNIGDKATVSIRHEMLDGSNGGRSNNTVVGVTTNPWKGTTLTANSDLLTNDSGRRLGATVGLDQQIQLSEKWSVSAGLRNRNVIDQEGEFVDVAPDAAVSPLEVNEDFTSAYIGAAYRTDVMSGSARVEARQSNIGNTWTGSASVARELSEELSLAGAARALFNEARTEPSQPNANGTSQLDLRLGAAWRPRGEETIVFDRFDISHDKNERGETETKIVNNLAVNQMVTDRLQATANYGVKHVSTEIAGQKLKSWNHLLGGEARFDVTERIDIGLRGSFLKSTGTDTMQYSYGPSIGVSPAKNIWLSAGYNVEGFKDDDFEAAEYSRKGVYLQMRIKFDQNTARGLLRRISPRDVIGSDTAQARSFANP